MASIQIARSAHGDLKEIFSYVSKQFFQNAEMLVLKIKQDIQILRSHPEIGQIVKEINDPSFREIKVFKYRIIYMYLENIVSILTIHHSSRLLSNNPNLEDYL